MTQEATVQADLDALKALFGEGEQDRIPANGPENFVGLPFIDDPVHELVRCGVYGSDRKGQFMLDRVRDQGLVWSIDRKFNRIILTSEGCAALGISPAA